MSWIVSYIRWAQNTLLNAIISLWPFGSIECYKDQCGKNVSVSPEESQKTSSHLKSSLIARSHEIRDLRCQLQKLNVGFETMAIILNKFDKSEDHKNGSSILNRLQSLQTKLETKDAEIVKLNKLLLESQELIENEKAKQNETLLGTQIEPSPDCEKIIQPSETEVKLKSIISEKETLIKRMEHELKENEKCWNNSKKNYLDEITHLNKIIKDNSASSEIISSSADEVNNHSKNQNNLQPEIESLKAVIDLKCEEIKKLRKDKGNLENKLVKYELTERNLNKTKATLEDLKTQIRSKVSSEQKLSEKNRQLQSSFEREMNENKRLSMEKEELVWKIQKKLSPSPKRSSKNFKYSSPSPKSPSSSITGLVQKSDSVSWKINYSENDLKKVFAEEFDSIETIGQNQSPYVTKIKDKSYKKHTEKILSAKDSVSTISKPLTPLKNPFIKAKRKTNNSLHNSYNLQLLFGQ